MPSGCWVGVVYQICIRRRELLTELSLEANPQVYVLVLRKRCLSHSERAFYEKSAENVDKIRW